METPGLWIGGYLTLGLIGRGGSGTVYRALDPKSGRPVALKVIRPDTAAAEDLARFRHEGALLCRLDHPGIARFLGSGSDREGHWLAMELVQGQTLSELLETGKPLPLKRALKLARDLVNAVRAMHQVGVVHRDIKPDNILLTDSGRAKLVDFGLARGPDSSRLTVAGELIGNPLFWAPETLGGQPAQPESDLYQIGVVLYMALTGELPFVGDSIRAYMDAIATQVPAPPSTHNAEIDEAVDAIVLNLMAQDPHLRPAAADALRAAVGGEELPEPVPVLADTKVEIFQPMPAEENEDFPRQVGHFELIDLLASSGMARVFRARHPRLERLFAVKLLLPSLVSRDEPRRRFLREMKILARLAHPNIVKIIDGGIAGDVPYIVQELLLGETLEDLIRKSAPLNWRRTLEILKDLAVGLEFLQSRGILHRDIKPSNVFVTQDGPVKLIDFGVAYHEGSTHLTRDGRLVGTPLFFAPEVIEGQAMNVQSELWALGCIAYHMITGRPHIGSASAPDWCRRILSEPIPPPHTIRPDIPEAASHMIARLLERDPARRTKDFVHFLAQIDGVLQPENKAPAHSRTTSKWWVYAGVGFVLVCLLLKVFAHRSPTRPTPKPSVIPVKRLAATDNTPFGAWQNYVHLERDLAGPPAARSKAVASLIRQAPIQLGNDPALWRHWFTLGRWLAAAPKSESPRSTIARRGPAEYMEWRLQRGHFHAGPRRWSLPANTEQQERLLLAAGIQYVTNWPDDGRAWLAFGRCLDAMGLVHEATTCYALALDRLGATMEEAPPHFWRALLRALLLVPSHSLEREWGPLVERLDGDITVWDGLYDEFHSTDSGRFERLLAANLNRRFSKDRAAMFLAQQWRDADDDQAAAVRLWQAALKRYPGSIGLRTQLYMYYMELGDTIRADALHSSSGWDDLARVRHAYACAVKLPENVPAASLKRDVALRRIAIFSLLERGQLDQALALSGTDGGSIEAITLFALADAGAGDIPGIGTRCAEVLDGWNIHWTVAMNTISTPAGVAFIQKQLEIVCNKYGTHTCLQAARALWESRRGHLKESIDLFSVVAGRADLNTIGEEWILELLCRPFWLHALGQPVPTELLARIPDLYHPSDRNRASLLVALRLGDLEGVRRMAQQLRQDKPRIGLWSLLLGWSTVATGSEKEINETLEALTVSARYQFDRRWMLTEVAAMRAAAGHRVAR